MSRTIRLPAGLPILLLAALASAQPGHDARRTRAANAAKALQTWVDGYVRGSFEPSGSIWFIRTSRQDYLQVAFAGRVLTPPTKRKQTTHFTTLQWLVKEAERHHTTEIADTLLALASAGYSRDLYSSHGIMVRDLGHFALMRSDSATLWQHVLRVATGEARAPQSEVEAVAVGDEERETERELTETARVMRRVSAVRLLGMRRQAVFRPALERCLSDDDPRIRMAAAEGFESLADLRNLYDLARRAISEQHPLVVMALLSAVERTLKKHRGQISISRGMNVVRMLLPLMGRKGWRNDMSIVRLVQAYPVKESISVLIHTMRGAQAEMDAVLKIINKDASPTLAHATWEALRRLTGALIGKDPGKWQRFWEAEKDRLDIVAPYRRRRSAGGTRSRGAFFGIPVVGREVVFVIDTSGSMKKPIATGTVVPGSGKRASRLEAAKLQMLNAVQGLPKSTRYHLVTFAAQVRVWNKRPVTANPQSRRTLSEALARVRPVGGTNVFAALLHALNASQQRYGQQIKDGVDEVFVLSDGVPTREIKNPAVLLRVVREINKFRKVRINTVFTGTGDGAEFMRKLAEENYGVFVRR